MSIVSSFRKSTNRHLGVIRLADGIGCVEMVQDGGEKPKIYLCEYLTVTPKDVKDSFVELLQANKIKKATCTGLLPMESYEVFAEEATENIGMDEMGDAMRWKIKDRLDYSVAEAVVDLYEMPHAPRAINEMVYVVASQKEPLQQIVESFFVPGKIRMQNIAIHELGLRNIASLLPEAPDGLILLHVRAKDTLLVITRNNNLFLSRRIDVGLTHLFNAVAGQKNVDDIIAKLTASQAMGDICSQIEQAMEYHGRRFQQSISRLYLAPMDRNLPELRAAISNNLPIRVKNLKLETIFDFVGDLPDTKVLNTTLPLLGALLTPKEPAEDSQAQRSVNMFDISFQPKIELINGANILKLQGAAMLLFAGLTFFSYQQLNKGQVRLHNLEQQKVKLTSELTTLEQKFEKPKKDLLLERRVKVQQALIKQKRMVLQILRGGYTFGNTKGFSGHFLELAREPLDGVRILRIRLQNGGSVLGINGIAETPEQVPHLVNSFNDKINLAGYPFRILAMERIVKEKDSPEDSPAVEGIRFSISTHPLVDEEEEKKKKDKLKVMDSAGALQANKEAFQSLTKELIGQALAGVN